MRILYITQFYAPENIAGAFRAQAHAAAWAKLGHEVTVFTAWPNHPKGELFPGYEMSKLGHEMFDDVDIYRNQLIINHDASFRKRAETGISFMCNGLSNLKHNEVLKNTQFDIVLASSGTVFAGMLGAEYARWAKLPLVVEFRDLAFDQLAASQSDTRGWKVFAMRLVELHLAKRADRVVVLTKGFKRRLIDHGIDDQKIEIVFNGVDPVECECTNREASSNTVRFGYFGTIGISQDVVRTIDILGGLRDCVSIKYRIIGDGASYEKTARRIDEGANPFVTLMPGISAEELEGYYQDVDMTVVSLQHNPAFAATIPSKIFQSFARGIPVLFIGPEGEASSLIAEGGAGIVLTGDDSDARERLKAFFLDESWRDQVSAMARNALRLVNDEYSRTKQAAKMISILESAVTKKGL